MIVMVLVIDDGDDDVSNSTHRERRGCRPAKCENGNVRREKPQIGSDKYPSLRQPKQQALLPWPG